MANEAKKARFNDAKLQAMFDAGLGSMTKPSDDQLFKLCVIELLADIRDKMPKATDPMSQIMRATGKK